MTTETKTHYRKAFNSPYLSSSDIIEPVILTIKHVRLESDKTKKTKDSFNTAYFVEKEIRHGESLKPMILNATNSRTMKALAGSAFIDDWNNVTVTIYVDTKVKMMGDIVEGLRISTEKPRNIKKKRTVAEFKADVDKNTKNSETLLKWRTSNGQEIVSTLGAEDQAEFKKHLNGLADIYNKNGAGE